MGSHRRICPSNMTWPSKVFLESTALFRLGPRLENVEFAELLQFRDKLGFELSVAEVSWREYLRRREKEVRDCLARIRQCRVDLAKHDQASDELEQAGQKASAHLQNVSKYFSTKLQNLGVTILPMPSVDIRQLLDMSLANDPPFEDSQSDAGEKTKEKGFRDALIMFTVLANIENRPQDNALIITDDKRLTEGLRVQASKHGMNLDVVANLQEAVLHITARIDEWYRGELRREADEAKGMLLRYRTQISQSLQEVRELTENDLGQGPMSGFLSDRERLSIQQLCSLAFDDVESALWKDADKDRSRILFKIRCLANVIATPQPSLMSSLGSTLGSTVFAVGGGKQSGSRLSVFDSILPVQKEIPVRLYGEAQLEKAGEGWKLLSLKVDKSLPEAEWIELQRLARELN
jgi:hypothetical protein